MANDREVLKVVWEGKIPAKFVVDSDNSDNDAFFLMLPRISYFALATDKVKKHFQRHVEKEDDIWFSYMDVPLKFHIPIGNFFFQSVTSLDFCGATRFAVAYECYEDMISWCNANFIKSTLFISGVIYDLLVGDNSLPWQINVHFNKFPDDVLFKFPNK